MVNVGFKRGSQSALDELLKLGTNANAIEGSFYLTMDTNRLYIGKADGSLAPVNQGVLTVETTADLPTAALAEQTGGFYYVTTGNILCVATGGQWVQINAVKTIQGVSNSFTTTGNNAVQITTTVNVGTDAAHYDSKNDSFTIAGAGSAHVKNSGKTVTITGDTYTLGAAADKVDSEKINISLTSSDTASTPTSVALKGGDNVTITEKDGVISIASSYVNTDTDTEVTNISFANATGENATGFVLTAQNTHKDIVNNTSNVENRTATFDPSITIGVDSTKKQTVKFVDGIASLDVYTKAEFDDALTALNAMTYRGTVGTAGTAGTTIRTNDDGLVTSIVNADGEALTCAIGDTFLVLDDLGSGVTKGSLLIARGTEVKGVISAGTLTFDTVANSGDTDTQYALKNAANNVNGIVLQQNAGGTTSPVGSLTINGGTVTNGASVSVTKTASGDDVVLTVTHDTVAAPTATPQTAVEYFPGEDEGSITAITGVQTDATGHLIGYNTTAVNLGKVSVSESYATAVTTTDGVTTAAITPSSTVTSTCNNKTVSSSTTGTALNLKSSSLELTAPAAGAVQIEMVWGSFE